LATNKNTLFTSAAAFGENTESQTKLFRESAAECNILCEFYDTGKELPLWWSRFVETYYVYGAHPESQWQWMRFADQRPADIPNVAWLNVSDLQAATNAVPVLRVLFSRCARLIFAFTAKYAKVLARNGWRMLTNG